MRKLDDPSWRYVPAAKSHVGFKQRLRRYAEMVKTEQHRGDSDGSALVAGNDLDGFGRVLAPLGDK